WTLGDDIAWMRPGPDGRLWAINPEAGFFGVAPGTSSKTNPNAMATLGKNSIFTNVAVTEDGSPWWEGIDGPVPERLTDWRGRPWRRGSSEKAVERPPAIFHVNWFRQDAEGKFIWPGFGENMRVLRWIVARAKGAGAAAESPIGMLPAKGAIDTSGLAVDGRTMEELLSVSKDDWRREAAGIGEFFGKFDGRLPAEMERQRQRLVKPLG